MKMICHIRNVVLLAVVHWTALVFVVTHAVPASLVLPTLGSVLILVGTSRAKAVSKKPAAVLEAA